MIAWFKSLPVWRRRELAGWVVGSVLMLAGGALVLYLGRLLFP